MTARKRPPLTRLGEVARRLPDPLLLVDGGGRILDANPAACRAFARTDDALRDLVLAELVSAEPAELAHYLQACSGSRQPVIGALTVGAGEDASSYRCDGAVLRPATAGERAVLFLRLRPRATASSGFHLLTSKVEELAGEVASRRRAELLLDGQRAVLELIAHGAPLERTLDELVRVTERLAPGDLRASVLLLDEERRHLRDAAGEGLPAAYREAIDGIAIGPEVGSCGTAAYHNRQVIVADIARDPLWREFRELAARHGLAACWSTPIPARDGSVLGTFALYYDEPREPVAEDQRVVEIMTRTASIAIERKRVERQVQELLANERSARAEAESANRAKDEFLAVVSHELRNPLNAILGWVRMLQTDGLDASLQSKGIETIARNANLQAELIDDVLDFARVTSGRLTLERQPVSLRSVVEKSCESVRPEASARGLALELELDDTDPTPVSVDPDRLQQAVSNVLWNAIKFTPEGGRITVELSHDVATGRIRVRDTGCGIDPEFLPHIFERFRQADASRSREHGGLGLGLAIVKHIVELHGGQVEAHSPGPGAGATFTLSIPLIRDAPRAEPRPAAAAMRLDGLHVLAVDDAADARDLLEVALSRSGARVSLAASADEALDKMRRGRPDILVCDIGMPGKDGFELIRDWRARESGSRLPALALTAYTREVDRQRALEAGFDRHVPKPVDPPTLIRAVAELAGLGEAPERQPPP